MTLAYIISKYAKVIIFSAYAKIGVPTDIKY